MPCVDFFWSGIRGLITKDSLNFFVECLGSDITITSWWSDAVDANLMTFKLDFVFLSVWLCFLVCLMTLKFRWGRGACCVIMPNFFLTCVRNRRDKPTFNGCNGARPHSCLDSGVRCQRGESMKTHWTLTCAASAARTRPFSRSYIRQGLLISINRVQSNGALWAKASRRRFLMMPFLKNLLQTFPTTKTIGVHLCW